VEWAASAFVLLLFALGILAVALVVQVVVLLIGVPIGAIAGWMGGRTDNLLMRFTDAVVKEVKAPDDLFNEVASKLTLRSLSELLLTIGFYMLVSRFLENTGVDIEDRPVH